MNKYQKAHPPLVPSSGKHESNKVGPSASMDKTAEEANKKYGNLKSSTDSRKASSKP
jgi:hypothetical protein